MIPVNVAPFLLDLAGDTSGRHALNVYLQRNRDVYNYEVSSFVA